MVDEHQMLIERQKTWKGFLRLFTWSSVAIVIVLVGMAIFLL